MKRSDIEIMAPCGSYEALRAAIDAGADSIYFGVGALNMRSASAANFTLDDLTKIVAEAHEGGLRAYLTVNTVVYDDELDTMHRLLDCAAAEGVDAVIVSDQAAILYAHSKGLEVHISTQLNVSNAETLRFYAQWADTVVLARELNLEQIASIHQKIVDENICGPSGRQVKIEMFAHGALCMSISGKCYLSLHFAGCSANRGACRQICRHSYRLVDRDTGEEIDVDGRYLLSPKDLCTIDFLDRFVEAGVEVLKIEGRARPAEYVKRVVECYHRALSSIEHGSYTPSRRAALKEQLSTVFNRGFWGGYYLGAPTVQLSEAYGSSATMRKVYVGKVTNVFKKVKVAEVKVEASPLERGGKLLITGETTGAVEFTADRLLVDEREVDVVPQGLSCTLKLPQAVHRGDRLFKWVDTSEVAAQE
ncbi:MAG: peptidase U32 family protein [Tidjanibacter sp.]|nr:peptidase U32 family protein [Tidjanibacter sp.]